MSSVLINVTITSLWGVALFDKYCKIFAKDNRDGTNRARGDYRGWLCKPQFDRIRDSFPFPRRRRTTDVSRMSHDADTEYPTAANPLFASDSLTKISSPSRSLSSSLSN
eukprot:CAMPEP_0198217194 /NCGR_PEP_ID=MMETSP1445-20131203/62163_1 /TAXON_ID=36898 /ORGANISM="Pyramimonas sp., Strain CCMP2087" /LENGTH=108 /DNA_ID=CAMNT_0043893769 /DNA_START=373 /DNA_END=696 /DNA_ORIENTATION=+